MLRPKRAGRSSRKSYGGPGNPPMAGAMTVLSGTMVSVRLPYAETRAGLLSSNNEGRSAAPSARSGGLDDVDGGPDGAGYIHIGGIEQVCIRRLF